MKLTLDQIIVPNDNPRQQFDEGKLISLGESIKRHGQLQPIIVRPRGKLYELVVGERRLRACALVDLDSIDASIRDLDDVSAYELKLIENIHREDLSDAEKGDAIYALWAFDKYKTIKEVAEAINVPYDTVRKNWIPKTNKLSNKVKDVVSTRHLTDEHARYLLKYPHSIQNKLAEVIIRRKISSYTKIIRPFIRLYDANPNMDLDELADKVLGINHITIPESMLTEEQKRKLKEAKAKSNRKPRKKTGKRVTKEDIRKKLGKNNVDMTEKVITQIRDTMAQVPHKNERIANIVNEELLGMRKRLEIFPSKSAMLEPKIKKLRFFEERGVIPYTVWNFPYRDNYAGDKDFHGNCSPQIVEQCMWRLTEEGDLVVDPMAGSGTVLDVCKKYSRRCIGYDIKPPENRPDIIQNDSRKIPLDNGFVDMVFIHPPYWGLVHYTRADENLPDLSRAKTSDEFLDMLEQVFRECYRILKPEKFMCVLIGDLIKDGRFVSLCRDVTSIGKNMGFLDYGYAVKLAHGEVSRKKSAIILAEPLYTQNLKISHDLVLFLRKPESNGD